MDPSLAKFIDPVRELKPSLKGGMSLAPTLIKAGFNFRSVSMNSPTESFLGLLVEQYWLYDREN